MAIITSAPLRMFALDQGGRMTPKAAGSSVKRLALGAALFIAPAVRAQSLAPDLAASLNNLSAQSGQDVSAQKAVAQRQTEELADGWGATPNVPFLLLA